MSKLQNMRIIEIPRFRAVSSGPKTLDDLFGAGAQFNIWVNEHKNLIRDHIFEPQDFLWHEDGDVNKSVWIFPVKEGVTEADTAPYEIVEFPGGMFLVATGDESDDRDINETINGMFDWINNSTVFEYGDFPKSGMCNMPNPDGSADNALNVAQQQIFLPLRFRSKN